MPLSDNQGQNYIYNALLPPGFFSDIIDLGHLYPGTAIITAIPLVFQCDGTVDPSVPMGHLTVADYVLQVAQISFLGDFDLVKDVSAVPDIDSIVDPVWVLKPFKNDPVAYKRDSTYNMTIVVNCDHTPYHDFESLLSGL